MFDIPDMSKAETRLWTVQISLRVKNVANSGSGQGLPPGGGGNTIPAPGALGTGYVLCESLSVRDEPSSAALPRATLEYGQTFDIMQADGEWCRVHLDGASGWANFQYVLMNPQYITTAAETPVYAYAGPDAKRVALIDANTTLAVIAETEGYYIVSLRGASGVMMK